MIIGISGKIGSGKDTTAEIIQLLDYINKYPNNYGFDTNFDLYLSNYSAFQIKYFADKLREVVELLTGVSPNLLKKRYVKDSSAGAHWGFMTYRDLLQKIGTNALRANLHEDVWVNALFSTYDISKNWLIPDTRFKNEAKAIQDRGGLIIRRTSDTKSKDKHPSECDLDNYDFDVIIPKTKTLEMLVNKVYQFLNVNRIVFFDLTDEHMKFILHNLERNELRRGEVLGEFKVSSE